MFERFKRVIGLAAEHETGGAWSIPDTGPSEPQPDYRDPAREAVESARLNNESDWGTNWKATGWHYYRTVPEVRAVVQYRSAAASRVRLYIGEITHDGTDPVPLTDGVDNDPYLEPLYRMLGGPLQQQKLQKQWSIYRAMDGECLIIAIRLTPEEQERVGVWDEWLWDVQSSHHVAQTGPVRLTIRTARGPVSRELTIAHDGYVDIPDDVIMLHDRNPDPRDPTLTDAPMRSVIEAVETFKNVTDSVNAAAISRMVMDGVLLMAPEVEVPGRNVDEHNDPVVYGIMHSIKAALKNRRAASAAAPFILRSAAPASEIPVNDQIAKLDLSTDFDARAIEISEWYVRRIPIGFGAPVEVAVGTEDQNHWNALYEGQDGARISIGPEMSDLCLLLTSGYLQREYRRMGARIDPERARNLTLWWDASALTQDPDRSATLIEMRKTDPTLVTPAEVRQASGLPAEPEDEQGTEPVPATSANPRSATSQTGGLISAIPSTSGFPSVRNPGFPSPARSGARLCRNRGTAANRQRNTRSRLKRNCRRSSWPVSR